jgi:phage-related baseplate assembly protein
MSPVPPAFLETAPAVIADEMVAAFEATTGRTLYPAQVERLLIDVMAYRESLVRQGIQNAAEQNLVDFADGGHLEALGRLLGVSSRLVATSSGCTWRIALAQAAAADTPFAAGWTAMAPDGAAWALGASAVIPAGQLYVDAEAKALVSGALQNGLPIGTVFTPLEGSATVTSRTVTGGGAEAEDDDQLRGRVLNAPFGFSVAGSAGAYRFHALSAHPSLVDVAVANLGPGTVGVYPLTKTGLPSQDILDAVAAALNAETVRPMNDAVVVAAPTRVAFTVEAHLTLYASFDGPTVMAAAEASLETYLQGRRAGLGRDLISSQVVRALSVDGVYKVELVGWVDRVLGPSEWAEGTAVVSQVGIANG